MLKIFWLALLLAGLVLPSYAGFHEVSGKITDTTGAVLEAASIAYCAPKTLPWSPSGSATKATSGSGISRRATTCSRLP